MLSALFFLLGPLCLSADETPHAPSLIPEIENVMEVCPRIYSGAQPPGPASFEALAAFGIKTIVSVDGATPDVESAKAAGIEYVHIPIGYDGIPLEQSAAMAKTLRTHEGPIYIHCHHGLHRGPAMGAIALMCETGASPRDAAAYMTEAKTSPNYKGLWRDVREFHRDAIADLDPELYEIAPVEDFVAAMSDIDGIWEHLTQAQENNWQAPPASPDATPAHQATLLHERYRELVRLSSEGWDDAFRDLMKQAEQQSMALQQAIEGEKWEDAERLMRRARSACSKCHAAYRNNGPAQSQPGADTKEMKTYSPAAP